MIIGTLALLALSLVFFWHLMGPWLRRRNYDRATRNPAVMSAVLWWTHELRKATFPSDPATHPPSSSIRTATAFRTAMMHLLAQKFASDADQLHDDIGWGPNCSTVLAEACAKADIDMRKCFPEGHRMRIRDYHVTVSRSGGAFWDSVWRKW